MSARERAFPLTTTLIDRFLGLAIKCWECRSDSDPKCSDPFDNSTLQITDCRQAPRLAHLPGVESTMCRKIRQKGSLHFTDHRFHLTNPSSLPVHGVWRYFRSCAYMGEPGIEGDERFCLMRTGTYNIFVEYCTCNSKDGCNDGTMHRPMLTLFLVSCIGAVLWGQRN